MRPVEDPAYHSIVVVDIERFGNPDRSDLHRMTAHNGLHAALRNALEHSNIDPDNCDIEDRGDGALILVPGTVPGRWLVDQWPSRLNAELLRYNAVCSEQAKIRLRMSLHGGDVRMAENGLVGTAVNLAFRLVDTDELRAALRESSDLISIIVSGTFYDDVVINEPAAQPALYRPVNVRVKEVDTTAWIRYPPAHVPADGKPAEDEATWRFDPWPDDDLDRGSLWPLVQALRQIPFLSEVDGRNVLVRLIGDELRTRLPVRPSAQPIGHLLAIADACVAHPDGLRALVEVLNRIEPDGPGVAAVAGAVQEMSALDLWPAAERNRLFSLLSGVVVPEIAEIYRAVAGPAAPGLYEQTTFLDVFQKLERLNADPSGVPKPLLFVEHVAARVRAELGIELRRWADEQAARFDLRAELELFRQNLPETMGISSLSPPSSEAYLVVQLQREGPTGDRYRLSHWRQLDLSEGWAPIRGKDVTGTYESMKYQVAALIEKAEVDWAQYHPDIRIEFVLDYENLNLDVDQWPWETDPVIPEPIGCRYLVAVRSRERMAQVKYHGSWRKRWAALRAQMASYGAIPPLACCRRKSPTDDGLRELMSDFNRKPELVALVLNEPPRRRYAGRDEVAVGIRAGVPIIVWHRDERVSAMFTRSVEELLQNTDDNHHLLERAKFARIVAFEEGPAGRHFGGQLTMLYDDPSRVVIPSQPAPPEGASVA